MQNEENFVAIGLTCAAATLGGFLFGFDSGVINGTVDGLRSAFQSDSATTGFNVASMLLGCAAGAFCAARLADHFGRRTILIVTAILFLVSAWGSGVAGSSPVFVFYRILGGAAVGAASVLAPAYISEIAPARIRGMLTSLQQVAIITGLFVAFVSNWFLAVEAGGSTAEFWFGFEAWRWMFWVEILPAGLFLLALLSIPESPRYLIIKGRKSAAVDVMQRLFGNAAATQKASEIEESLAADRHKPRLSDLLQPGTSRPRTVVWIGIGLAVFQQLVGINVVFYYGAVLWQSVGFAESDALLINVISGGTSIVACLITISVIDRIGRRPLLLLGSIGMAVTLGVMAVAFASGEIGAGGALNLSDAMGTAALFAGNAYVFLFNISWGPVMWVMLGEMFPNQLRGSALAIAGFAQWFANFCVTLTFPILLAGIGLAAAYSIYATFSLLSVLFVAKLVYETRGRELEQMQG